jgi:hypothetical protein
MYAVCWLHKVILIQPTKWIFWTNCVHSWYGVGMMVRTLRSRCVLCTLYTVSRIHLADFMFLLYIAQSRQSTRLFLQSSELGPPAPSTAGECVPPPPLVQGGGAHSPACEGVTIRSWCDHVKISIKWLWPVKVTLKVIKRRLKVFCWSCDGAPLKWNKKNCRTSSLSLRIKWASSRLSIRMIGQYL